MARHVGLFVAAVVITCACAVPDGALTAPTEPLAHTAGTWFLDVDVGTPVAGHKAWLFFEYVPSAGTPSGRQDPIAGSQIAVSAQCAACVPSSIVATAERYPAIGPGNVAHDGATAGFAVPVTFPAAGTWHVQPFGSDVDVRGLDVFEPPLVHVRGRMPLPAACGREQVASLVKRFERGYNTGDRELLASAVQSSVDFSMAGGAVPLIAADREQLVAGVLDRHARGEKLHVTVVFAANDGYWGGVAMAIYATRMAPDLPAAGQRIAGNAAMWCTQHQFIHLNFGA